MRGKESEFERKRDREEKRETERVSESVRGKERVERERVRKRERVSERVSVRGKEWGGGSVREDRGWRQHEGPQEQLKSRAEKMLYIITDVTIVSILSEDKFVAQTNTVF